MVSDGMSPGVFTMAQNLSLLTRRSDTAWWNLYQDPKSARGLMDTASADSLVTDSAAASSAWGGGKRVNNRSINMAPDGSRNTPIAALLKAKNPANLVGLVTTATVTHATPAGFVANSPDRDLEHQIAPQYLNRVDIILGGGRKFFDSSLREDSRDLEGEFAGAGYDVIHNREQLLASKKPRLLGTFSNSHIPFTIDRDQDPELRKSVPTLEEMSVAALSRFMDSGQRFLLQIEGARVDHAAHLNDAVGMLHDQLAFDDTLGRVLQMTSDHPDILVIATSDHGNGNPGLNGVGKNYTNCNACFRSLSEGKASVERIFERWQQDTRKSPGTMKKLVSESLGFAMSEAEAEAVVAAQQPGKVGEWNHLLDNPPGILGQIAGNHSGVTWTSVNHTSDPTIVSARGCEASRLDGIVINTDIFQHVSDLLLHS